jgi:acetyl-CoA acetyltransferase
LRQASEKALEQAKRGIADFGFFAIYDCFPVCFLKSLEDLGLCPVGKSGPWIQNKYEELVRLKGSGKSEEEIEREFVKVFPFNTHGGLMHFAAPWEAPAAFNIIEAVQQLREECDKSYKQVKFPRDKTKIALVTGNGGVFSSAGVLVIEKNHLNKSNL